MYVRWNISHYFSKFYLFNFAPKNHFLLLNVRNEFFSLFIAENLLAESQAIFCRSCEMSLPLTQKVIYSFSCWNLLPFQSLTWVAKLNPRKQINPRMSYVSFQVSEWRLLQAKVSSNQIWEAVIRELLADVYT